VATVVPNYAGGYWGDSAEIRTGATGGIANITGWFSWDYGFLDIDPDTYRYFCNSQPESDSAAAQATVPTCNIVENFTGSKTQGDQLQFLADANECSESLGPIDCTSPTWWHWNMEGTATVNNDASRWSISRQLVSDHRAGHYVNSAGSLIAFDDVPVTPGPDGPGPGFTQNNAGQKNLFWIDGPGNFKFFSGFTINDMTFVFNFTDTVQSLDSNVSCTANWHAKLRVDNAALNTAVSEGGPGFISTTF